MQDDSIFLSSEDRDFVEWRYKALLSRYPMLGKIKPLYDYMEDVKRLVVSDAPKDYSVVSACWLLNKTLTEAIDAEYPPVYKTYHHKDGTEVSIERVDSIRGEWCLHTRHGKNDDSWIVGSLAGRYNIDKDVLRTMLTDEYRCLVGDSCREKWGF